MALFLGVDVGTYETKGVLVDENGRIVATAARGHKMLVPRPGWAEHRPEEDWWGDFVAVVQELGQQDGVDLSAVSAIGCSAIGPCMLPIDQNGQPLMNGVLYGVDNRAARQVDALTEAIGEDVLVEQCGNALTSQSVGPKILWLKEERPELFEKTDKILSATSYLVLKLTDKISIDHYTAANFSPLYLVEGNRWGSDLTDGIIGKDALPDLYWSTDIVGPVTPGAAAETGLPAGTPVIAGTIDAASEAVSVGVTQPGEMMVMYGSTIFTIMVSEDRIADPRLWYAPWLYEGQHASMAGLATSGTLTHWFRDQFARDLATDEAFAALAQEARSSPPGAKGLIILPYFSGERTPIHDPSAKGMVFGLNLTHTRGDIYRALLEGIGFGTAHILQTYDEIGHSPAELFAVGGGTKNDVWLQATSDAAGQAQTLRERTIGAAYGDAFLAAQAVGAVVPEDIEVWNQRSGRIEPRDQFKDRYQDLFKTFRELYDQTKGSMRALDLHQN